ncbi:hypothetical protein [Aeromonas veronii]|uniref:Uncharacterized protein n=1 Tax=Aeromonas veronii TaxID=654 RepID=A0A2T4MWS6_AERVE|nr:hypothetical protein [Aeromonas veronii]PTH79043.1 hypothetical protein DAA48_21640 [Aeromonas veronii]
MRLSELQFFDIRLDGEFTSATGAKGRIVGHEFAKNGNEFELFLDFKWDNGTSSNRVLFPHECGKISINDDDIPLYLRGKKKQEDTESDC